MQGACRRLGCCKRLHLSALDQPHCTRRHKHVCVSDEQYVGIALSYSLRDNLLEEVTSDLAIAMATTGDGFAPSQVSLGVSSTFRAL